MIEAKSLQSGNLLRKNFNFYFDYNYVQNSNSKSFKIKQSNS